MRRLPHKLNDLRSVLVMDNPPCYLAATRPRRFRLTTLQQSSAGISKNQTR